MLPYFEAFLVKHTGAVARPFSFAAWQNISPASGAPSKDSARRLSRLTPLHVAAAKGQLHVVQALINYGADINQAFNNVTPLRLAVDRGHVSVVDYLVSLAPINLNPAYVPQPTLLHEASSRGHILVVETLLRHPETVINSTFLGSTPLHLAASSGHYMVVERLLKHVEIGVNPTAQGVRTPLHLAASSGHFMVVEILLSHPGIDVNPTDRRGRTPLHEAAVSGNSQVVGHFLQHRDINSHTTDENGHTPLQLAVFRGFWKVVCVLLDCDIEAAHRKLSQVLQQTPICPLEVMKRLLAHRDFHDVNVLDNSSGSKGWLLNVAIHSGHYDCVQLVLSHKDIDVNLKSGYDCRTRLPLASKRGNAEMVKLLLQHKDIDVNLEKGHTERTPLAIASKYGNVEIVKLLLRRKDIDINKGGANTWSSSALQRARSNGRAEIVELLLQHGAIDHDMTTPSSGDGADMANSSSIAKPHFEEPSDHDLESMPHSFLDEYMEEVDQSEPVDEWGC